MGVEQPGCATKQQKQKRDRADSLCCRLDRVSDVRLDEEVDDVEDDYLDESVRVERDDSPAIEVVGVLPVDLDENIRYKIPIPETNIPTQAGSEVRFDKRDLPADPLITPAPELLPVVVEESESLDQEQGIRVEKRATWTTPDFLKTFFPLFVTFACSCLIESAAPVVTSTFTDVVQTWNYTTVSLSSSE